MKHVPVKGQALRMFSALSGSYDQVLDYATLMQDRRWKDWLVRSVGLTKGEKVLDLGCGTCVLEERLRTDTFLVGLDLTEGMLRAAQEKRLINAAHLLLSDGERLPFRDACFDAVVSCYVVKYCNPKTLASEIARVLRLGGRLVLYDFARPRGTLWPLNAMYAYGGLRLVSRLLEISHSMNAYTFSALPELIAGRPWDEGFGDTLAQMGFSEITETLLPGGATVGFRARMAV
jgi:demethylmenaquinone methyltransferase/2-methoxy-6-polyprenyl-1,4-benzoquinol methylase